MDTPKTKRTGLLYFNDLETGNPVVTEIDLPIETNISTLAWGLDFIRVLREQPRLFLWLIRLLMGRYAWRELIGLRDSIEKAGYNTDFCYGIEGAKYHEDKVGDL